MNHHAAHVICDNADHRAAEEAAAFMVLEWMMDRSSECYHARWLDTLQQDLFRKVQNGGGSYGVGEISAEDAFTIRALMEVGGWWRWDDEAGRPVRILPRDLTAWYEGGMK